MRILWCLLLSQYRLIELAAELLDQSRRHSYCFGVLPAIDDVAVECRFTLDLIKYVVNYRNTSLTHRV